MPHLSLLVSLAWVASVVACNPGGHAAVDSVATPDGSLRATTITRDLDTPWELRLGPDGMLWVSERGGRVSRVDPATGTRTTVGTVPGVLQSGEGGLMGIALHPRYPQEPWLYAMHTYAGPGFGARNRLVRARVTNGQLGAPEVLLDGIPGSGIHDGSRLLFAADGFLYVTTGDASDAALAQDRRSLAGKVLRLTDTGQPAPGNPFGDAIWSFGHRNPQGLAQQPGTGALYVTEHGPGDNDEVNRIDRGRNYGWPTVHGVCDDAQERAFCEANAVAEPLVTWTPTIAPAGAVFYDATLIPGWRGSFLFVTLKEATLHRLVLSADGTRVTRSQEYFGGEFGRLRAIAVGARGELYVATSNRDGRGSVATGDDRIIRIEPQ
ncbi:MAG TPA: PQQ-dependent sugar dehydrogenase [Gemmatimonadaceae bacterium]